MVLFGILVIRFLDLLFCGLFRDPHYFVVVFVYIEVRGSLTKEVARRETSIDECNQLNHPVRI